MYSTSKPRCQVVAEEMRAGVVLLARRVDGRNPHQIGGELDDFVGRAIDFLEHALDGLHGGGVYNIAIMKVWMCAALLMFAGLKPCATMTAVAQGSRSASDVAQGVSPANHTLTAVPGIKVGHHTLTERPTGCTVVLIEAGATAGVDVRGAAPATRDTDLLNPSKMVEQIYGIALSGGSHTMVDGDTVFAVATGTEAGEPDIDRARRAGGRRDGHRGPPRGDAGDRSAEPAAVRDLK